MSERARIAAVILAAGASSRMGNPKALLDFPGPPPREVFLDRLIRILSGVCSPVIVVLGSNAEAVRTGSKRISGVHVVLNGEWELGQLSSLQCGLRAVPPDAEAVLFTLVDHPAVAPETAAEMSARFYKDRPDVIVPKWNGKHGHPVLVAPHVAAEMLALPLNGQARDVIHRHAADTLYLDTQDSGVVTGIDDPPSYNALAGTVRL